MDAILDYRPDRAVYRIYMGGGGAAMLIGNRDGIRHERLIERIELGDEMPVWLEIDRMEYDALSKAILQAESPRLAEASLLTTMLEDTRGIRDRVLTLLEDELQK